MSASASLVGSLDGGRQLVEPVVGDDGRDAEPGGPQAVLVGGAGGHHGQRSHLEPPQVVDRGLVEARRLERDHGGVGLARGGRREQVGDVDAAAQHDHARLALEQAQHRGLPGRTRRQDQDDDHRCLRTLSRGGPR